MRILKYFLVKNKRIIIIAVIILICAIAIAVGVHTQLENNNKIAAKKEEESANYEELKNSFEYIFSNNINKEDTAKLNINYDEFIYCKYDISEEKEGKYKINAKIPFFKSDDASDSNIEKIDNEIFDTFGRKIVDILNSDSINETYNVDYVAYANNNIVSLVIRCKYKSGSNPQREIIKTYNYDLENKKILNILDIIDYKGLNKEQVQKEIRKEIKNINNEKKTINEQGYNVYTRDEQDKMYEVDNTPNFFIGRNNYLYLVYAYGNNNYTSEIDLIIF